MPPPPAPSAGSTYDEAEYPSASFTQTHPDKLCAMARLFGLDAPDPASARVLELGCAHGANLLPMAQHAPRGRFLGIDASARQIAQGQAVIAATGLTNIELRQQDIRDFPASEGKFDYIIAHGVFSWVPDDVREKILALCRDHLAPNGVAFVSYNALPGWSMRLALRDMMLFHTRGLPDAKAKVQQARALTAFLAEAVPAQSGPYGQLLDQELKTMQKYADNYLRHDILEESNQPFYFHEFIARAGGAGLQYLGETSLGQMLASNFPPAVTATLEKIGRDLIAKEQYMDFVRNRVFRQTLLCHQAVPLVRELGVDALKSLHFVSLLQKPDGGAVDFRPGVVQAFRPQGKTDLAVQTDQPFLKALLDTLAEHERRRISFAELVAATRTKARPFIDSRHATAASADETHVAANLLQLYGAGFVDSFASRVPLHATLPERPTITPLARYQAAHGMDVTSPLHERHQVETTARLILAACDGTRDFDGLVSVLDAAARDGKIQLVADNRPVTDEARRRRILTEGTESVLKRLIALGFFLA